METAYQAGLITSRKDKRGKLIFGLKEPRYLIANKLGVPQRKATNLVHLNQSQAQDQPKAMAPKQQKMAVL